MMPGVPRRKMPKTYELDRQFGGGSRAQRRGRIRSDAYKRPRNESGREQLTNRLMAIRKGGQARLLGRRQRRTVL